MSHYTRRNLNETTQQFSGQFFTVIATVNQTYVFLYLGISIIPAWGNLDLWLIFFTLVSKKSLFHSFSFLTLF